MIATPPPHLLNTPRLYLRALGPADIDVVMPLRSDPAAMERMLEGVQDRRAALETLKNFEAFWTTQGIGMFGVMMRPDGLGLALRYSFLPAARGRGYAREAVMAIIDHALREPEGLPRLVAVLSDDNKSSQALAEDLGFTLEQSFYRGRRKMLVYGLSASFWQARQKLADYLVTVKASLSK